MPLPLVPLLPFTVVFIVGILVEGSGVTAYILTVPLAFAAALVFFKRHYGAILCCAFSLGFIVAALHSPPTLRDDILGPRAEYSAVAKEVRVYEPAQVIIAEVDSVGGGGCTPFLAKITVPSSLPEVDETDRINFTVKLSPLLSRQDLPEEVDYDAMLRRRGVVCEGFVRPDSLRVLCAEGGILNDIRRMRPLLSRQIAISGLSAEAKEFLNTTLTGDRSMLSSDTRELFSSTGLSHILALSGLHVCVLIGFASVLLFPLYLCGLRNTRWVLLIILLWIFAIMTGLLPSVLRSVIMATVMIIAYIYQRQRSSFNSLCLAALLILLFAPYSIYSVGFQLSFLAVASILLFGEKFNPVPQRRHLLHSLFSFPAVTLAAVLGTMAVSVYYFNILPLGFIPANFVASLLLPVALSSGIVVLIAQAVGIPAGFFVYIADKSVEFITATAEAVDSVTWLAVDGVYITPVMLAGCMLTVASFALWLYRHRMVYVCATIILVVTTASVAAFAEDPAEGVEAYIPRSRHHTSLIVREGRKVHVMTTAPSQLHADIETDFRSKYRRYLLSRSVDSLSLRGFSRENCEIVNLCGRRLLFVFDNSHIRGLKGAERPDYAVVCAGFRGDILTLVDSVCADTILLSADLNSRRHDRYARELSDAGVPHRSLREAPFALR